ncbi:hypothetical protein [Streptomyces sp. NPDC127190]|uniref:hypothetical protein n=1 Tax=unclassified Streptomyces TaxID=2593676 RepID=UPI00363953B7
MTQAAVSELEERVPGRRWTVRMDPVGRGSATVRVSCSRPACAEQRLPSAAAGRAAAAAHLRAHLRAAPAPRAGAYCACRAEGCRAHLSDAGRHPRAEPWRCGGPVVLAVLSDKEGRWWQALECCSRCAAATPGARTAAVSGAPGPRTGDRPAAPTTSPGAGPTTGPGAGPGAGPTTGAGAGPTTGPGAGPGAGPTTGAGAGPTTGAGAGPTTGPGAGVPQFSDRQAVAGARAPAPRSAPARRRPAQAKISQRVIPHDLRPVALRDELIELGGLFRAYQQRAEPDLELLAGLQERKARAFTAWADATGDGALRWEAQRAERAAATIRLQHQYRTGGIAGVDGPAVPRLLTVPTQWEHVRSVLAYVVGHSPLPGPEARLLVLMVTLRTAHTGTGNLVGRDLTGLGLTDPEGLVEQLTGCGWLTLPGTAGELVASRPEDPVPVTVPSLVPRADGTGPFTFGRKMRPRLSGWAQKVVSDKKLRKAKAGAGTRLLALTLATRTDASGRLGPGGEGIPHGALASWVPVGTGELRHLVDQLTAADWLTDAALTDTHLTGRLTERVLPLTCPLQP